MSKPNNVDPKPVNPNAGDPNSLDPNALDPKTAKNTMAAWALGFGIISVICVVSIGLVVYALLPGVIAIVLSIIALRRAKATAFLQPRKGMALTALIFGVLCSLAAVLVLVLILPKLSECQGIEDDAELQQCVTEQLS